MLYFTQAQLQNMNGNKPMTVFDTDDNVIRYYNPTATTDGYSGIVTGRGAGDPARWVPENQNLINTLNNSGLFKVKTGPITNYTFTTIILADAISWNIAFHSMSIKIRSFSGSGGTGFYWEHFDVLRRNSPLYLYIRNAAGYTWSSYQIFGLVPTTI